jgi:putative FmdB family regulatory protein
MPIYVYHCRDCGEKFEKLFLSARSAEAGVSCPVCQSEEVEQRPALFGLGGSPSSSAENCAVPSG